jgi:hypothetical protein
MPTKEQLKAGQAIILAVAETIRESKEAPTGVLYAALMDKVSLEGFNKIIAILENTRLVKVHNHVARWTGPEVQGGNQQ